MFQSLLAVVLVASAFAQSADPGEARSRAATAAQVIAEKDAASSVAMVRADDPVLTIHGVCPPSQKPMASGMEGCSTVMSRRDFDNLMKIAGPNVPPSAEARQRLAGAYTDLVGLADAARKLGIGESAQFQQTMELLRLRTLADMYRTALEADAKIVSDAEVEEYYRSHVLEFEEVKLHRVVIPKTNLAVKDRQEYEKKALRIAGEMRDRAAKGEDLEVLQKDAYAALGFSAIAPSTDVGNRRRSGLTPEVAEDVFALAAGGISKVEIESYSVVIYKVDAKVTLPWQRVKEEIIHEITKERIETGLKAASRAIRADLNQKYFGVAELTQ